MRLTGTSYAVLSVLDALGPATPYDLKQALEVSVQNFWPIPHTTAYSEPERLARAGLLSVEQEPSGRRRKLYALTEEGRARLAEWAADVSLSPPQLREEAALKVFAGADPAPVMRARLEWHLAKREELRGYLDAIGADERVAGVRNSLLVGIGYNTAIIDALERWFETGETLGVPPARTRGRSDGDRGVERPVAP